jgi:hypothetical protein
LIFIIYKPTVKMKNLITIFMLCFLAFQCYAQSNPDLKAGIGLPYVFGNENSEQNLHTITGFPSLSVEKPIGFGGHRKKKFSINPGLAYFFFKEKEVRGNDVVGLDNQLNHHSVNAYAKWLYQLKLDRKSQAFLYFGAVTALNIFTKTKGDKIAYSDSEVEPIEIDINDSGQNFFDLFYYGVVAGFQPNAKITKMIKPSFEVKFYPGLVIRKDEKQSTVEITVLLGYHQ